jgi:hypothetical protein
MPSPTGTCVSGDGAQCQSYSATADGHRDLHIALPRRLVSCAFSPGRQPTPRRLPSIGGASTQPSGGAVGSQSSEAAAENPSGTAAKAKAVAPGWCAPQRRTAAVRSGPCPLSIPLASAYPRQRDEKTINTRGRSP